MSAQLSFCKTARRARRPSTGHGGMRQYAHRSPPIRQQFIAFDPVPHTFTCRATVAQLAASARTPSANSPAALKSP